MSAIELCLIREALARACTEAETAFALQGLGAYPIVQSGSAELRAQWIPRVADGTAVAAFALAEPDAGSDAASLSLRAEPDGAGYRLTGEKLWISNAPEADLYTVFARTGADGARGVSAFVVSGDSEGLSGEPRELLAPHAIGSLSFDGVYVPCEQMLGNEGEGFRVAMRTLDLFRPSVGAFAVGMGRTAIALAAAHATMRHAFGRPLKDNQAVSHRLADASARVESARLVVHHAAAAHDAGGARSGARRDGEAARDRGRPGGGRRRRPDPRGGRPRARAPTRASLPRRAGAANLRGRVGDPAGDHRAISVPLGRRSARR